MSIDSNNKKEGFQANNGSKGHEHDSYKSNENMFNAIAKQTTEGLIVADARGKFLFANHSFCKMTGYSDEELHELHVFELMDEDQHHFFIERDMYFGKPITVRLNHKDGHKFFVEIIGDNILVDGELHVLGTMRDVTSKVLWEQKIQNLNKELEAKVQQRTEELEESLKIKELLLQEVTHRVKNNLQVISSILNLQKHTVRSDEAMDICTETSNRIYSMSLIHEILYKDKAFNSVSFHDFIENLILHLREVFNLDGKIRFENKCEKTVLPIDIATSCGMIATELITNSIKYAFPTSTADDTVIIALHEKGNDFEFRIEDNGIGLPEGIDIKNSQSLGLQIVDNLVEQLDGTMEVNDKNGTHFLIRFTTPQISGQLDRIG